MYPVRFSLTKSTFSLLVILFFGYVIIQANQFYIQEESLNIHERFVARNTQPSSAIKLNNIELVPIEAGDSVTKHVVQRGETLSTIAAQYGTTIGKIKEINNTQSDFLRVGQELFITDVPGIIHTMKEDTNFLVFANRYSLDLEDLLTLNYATQEEAKIAAGTEVFLPITMEKAYDLNLEEKPQPKPQRIIARPETTRTVPAPQPVAQEQIQATPTTQPKIVTPVAEPVTVEATPVQVEQERSVTNAVVQETQTKSLVGTVEAQWRDNGPIVRNGFYPGYCTYRAAKKRPDIFPYTSPTTQTRPFGGNAKARLANAQAAGLPTGSTPANNAIAGFKRGGPGYYSYGHVGVIVKIDREGRAFLMSEMNGPGGKGVVSHRWISMDDKNISGYIY